MRIPPVRVMREGKLNRDVVDIILLNSRTPDERSGDLQRADCGEHRRHAKRAGLFERYGCATTDATIAAYLDFTEKRFARRSSGCPAGPLRRPRNISTAT